MQGGEEGGPGGGFPLRFFFSVPNGICCSLISILYDVVPDSSTVIERARGVVGQERGREARRDEATDSVGVCESLRASRPLRHLISRGLGACIRGSNECPCDKMRALGDCRSGAKVMDLFDRAIEFIDKAENSRSSHLQDRHGTSSPKSPSKM